jgi:hypothetical protein
MPSLFSHAPALFLHAPRSLDSALSAKARLRGGSRRRKAYPPTCSLPQTGSPLHPPPRDTQGRGRRRQTACGRARGVSAGSLAKHCVAAAGRAACTWQRRAAPRERAILSRWPSSCASRVARLSGRCSTAARPVSRASRRARFARRSGCGGAVLEPHLAATWKAPRISRAASRILARSTAVSFRCSLPAAFPPRLRGSCGVLVLSSCVLPGELSVP